MYKTKILGLLNLIFNIIFFIIIIILFILKFRVYSGGIIDVLLMLFAWFYIIFTPMVAIFVLIFGDRKKWEVISNYIVFFIWFIFMSSTFIS